MLTLRRRFLIGIGVFAILGAGVGIGMFVQYRFQIGVIARASQPFLDFARGLSGEGGPSGPPPAMEHWRYPGATEQSSGRGPSLEANGQTVKPASQYLVLATADDFQKVAAYYGTKLGLGGVYDGQFGGMNRTSTEHGFQLAIADGLDPRAGPQTVRPVRVQCLRQTCASYGMIVFITRADKETHTHVVLLYDPKVTNSAP